MPATGKRRALGQHFLRDPAVARAIVDLVSPTPRDLVVEIGPGEGALTGLLSERAGGFLALEVDPALAERLAGRFDVREADARTFDYRSLSAPGGRVLVVGNLPYSVSKPILMRLTEAHATLAEMALMLQREVAERVAARPGGKTYGALSVLTQLHWEVRLALRVPPGAFRPPPRVESAVLHLTSRAEPAVPVTDDARFRRVVLAAFGQRRKAVANALAAGLHRSVATTRAWLAVTGIDPGRRAETLSLDDFARLANTLECQAQAERSASQARLGRA
ncbi:MAG: ribosomal RNA small subunit methyltransferase A [Candidatus Rokubacteria bacterium]|nr:ribosomal RNA small subunit methyltransferase A [Candidatus Rokubacteria bacterium]